MTYTITLGDGTRLENLELSGNNYISSKKLTEDDFKDLSTVTITDSDGKEEVHKDMELVQVTTYGDGKYYFILADPTPDELEKRELRKQLAAANSDITSLQEALCDVYEAALS